MNDLDKALQLLSEKLGVAADRLLDVMIYQADIYVAVYVTIWVSLLTIHILLFLNVRRIRRRSGEDLNIYFVGFIGIFLIALIIVAVCEAYPLITAIFNPEYWALQEILKALN